MSRRSLPSTPSSALSPSVARGTDTRGTDAPGTDAADVATTPTRTPAPEHAVVVENDADETRSVVVTVTRSDRSDVVHHDTHRVAADATVDAYDLADAAPDGVETFHVTAECGPGTATARLRTNTATGDLRLVVSPDDAISVVRTSDHG
ncbi:hypothetical protein [Halorubellus sp. PRR65]|uniref:hypothetical protein n=1 Tax=Halorubellus sp. PRR65 TaxID=3098148 RepID=UPI002B263D96|nr:hypothetical protein [Halorubellus sp. PRR65]